MYVMYKQSEYGNAIACGLPNASSIGAMWWGYVIDEEYCECVIHCRLWLNP